MTTLAESPVLTTQLPSVDAKQLSWAACSVGQRVEVLAAVRPMLVENAAALFACNPLLATSTYADFLVAELLPLLDAIRFLEKSAASILEVRHLGRKGLPGWLAGVRTCVERVPLGSVLVISPANYPLMIGGIQATQALVAGNLVTWKPGRGGAPMARLFATLLQRAGLPDGVLRVTDDDTETAKRELALGPAKVIFTGSSNAGQAVAAMAANTGTQMIAELSGCDAMIALPSAKRELVIDAIAFSMRLNASATCMASRRLLLVGNGHEDLLSKLAQRFASMQGVPIQPETRGKLKAALVQATAEGASVIGDVDADLLQPLLVLNGQPTMAIAQADLFAPVITVIKLDLTQDVIDAERQCPFGLTASIFGEERAARSLGKQLEVGTVLINDLIVPTTDPRAPFGGRKASGYGVTRGAEGLLDLTAIKVCYVRRGNTRRHYQPTTNEHAAFFEHYIRLSHARGFRNKWSNIVGLISAARKLK